MTGITILIGIGSIVLLLFVTIFALASRYIRCAPDQILVIFGNTGDNKSGKSARCHHGGGAFVWPIIQSHQFLDLTPIFEENHRLLDSILRQFAQVGLRQS